MPGTTVLTYYSSRGTVFYTPTDSISEQERLPDPPCQPRIRRPHQIQITRLPVGFVPFDLRPQPAPREPNKPSRIRLALEKLATRENAKRVFGSVFSSLSSAPSTSSTASTSAANSTRSTSPSSRLPSLSSASSDPAPLYARRSGLGPSVLDESTMSRTSVDSSRTSARTGGLPSRHSVSASSFHSIKKSELSEQEKPVASKDGVAVYFILAEETIYLTGMDHDGTQRSSGGGASAILRGKLQLNVTKSAKLKSVTVKFTGKAKTDWPEGLPPQRVEKFEEDSLRTQVIPFFNALYEGSDVGYGTLCNYALRNKSASSSVTNLGSLTPERPSSPSGFSIPGLSGRASRSSTLSSSLSSSLMSSRETKRLSLQTTQSRSFQKGDSPFGPTPQQKGYKIFHPGIYEYSFEIPIDNNSPETTKLALATVTWQLEALVERAGAFRANLHGFKEIPVIRCPSEESLELTEPISITRTWEDQLHYEIMISGKAFPLGTKIPIAFKLTPLAKVQIHKVKVIITENVEYFTNDHKVSRKETTKKLLLFEKSAGKPLGTEFAGSEVTFNRGGEPTPEDRVRARQHAQWLRTNQGSNEPLPPPSDNLLGDLDLGLESLWGITEMEAMVQLPTCEMMEKNKLLKLHHACTWKNVNVHHWIKVVMRISRRDETSDDPTKRRHFEISIDSPLTLLSCRATQANITLPEYSAPDETNVGRQHVCGCPNSAMSNVSPIHSASEVVTLGSLGLDGPADTAEVFPPPSLARPAQAHLSTNAAAGVQRPIHMLRNPSYNPPAFDAEEPPPPLATPPPLYDNIVGTPSHDGLADYFARLGVEYEDDDPTSDEESNRASSRGRVNIANPRTPGGRIARSMDIDRNFMFNADASRALTARSGAASSSSSAGSTLD